MAQNPINNTTMDTSINANEATDEPATKRQKRATPFDHLKTRNDEELVDSFVLYNHSLSSRQCCISRFRGNNLSCNCLSVLSKAPDDHPDIFCEAVAEYQVYFGRLEWKEQKKIAIEWIRSNQSWARSKKFPIPFLIGTDDDVTRYKQLKECTICASSMMNILGKGREWWYSCSNHVDNSTLPEHKLKGKPSNRKARFDLLHKDALKAHFEELRREVIPIATRFVREKTGETTTRDDDDKIEQLPPYVTKRSCYAKYCFERGWKISTNNKGTETKTAIENTQQQDIPSWFAYRSYWNTNYPCLKVSRPAEDLCSWCYKFYNRHKFRLNSSDTTLSSTDEQGNNNEEVLPPHDDDEQQESIDNAGTDLSTIDAATVELEQDILLASIHVRKARAQRALVNTKIDLARQCRTNKTPHADRTYTFIADFGQNLALPHFGSQQPGDSYYLTPSTLFNFGVADVSHTNTEDGTEADHLYCHMFKEGDGGKGGNTVASMIMKTLYKLDILKKDAYGEAMKAKELNIIMDNCAGQNKNNHVILLAPYLVELGYFKRVNIIFLIVGHTKNVCDRRFNNLKALYHKSQVFTLDMAVDVCNKSKFVTVWKIDREDWRDYHGLLSKAYLTNDKTSTANKKKLAIYTNHIFYCEETTTAKPFLILCTRVSDLPEHTVESAFIINKKLTIEAGKTPEERLALLQLIQPAIIEYKGLPGYKQVLLYEKYRPFVPVQFHKDDLYKKPTKQLLDEEKKDQKERKVYKKEKKEAKTKITKLDI